MEMSEEKKKTPWFAWPFVGLWRFVTWILELTGRLVVIILGIVLMILGAVATLTVLGAIVGIPLIVFGFLLTLRGLF
jgi:hypothetical protein